MRFIPAVSGVQVSVPPPFEFDNTASAVFFLSPPQVLEKDLKKLLTNDLKACIIIKVANESDEHERVSYNIKKNLDWSAKC